MVAIFHIIQVEDFTTLLWNKWPDIITPDTLDSCDVEFN